jgi:hypothetical protein
VDATAVIVLVRDITIIVAGGIFSIVLLIIGFLTLRMYRQLYPAVLRTTQNVEQSSGIILAVVSQPLNLVTALLETGNRVWGLVEKIRTRDRSDEEDEED